MREDWAWVMEMVEEWGSCQVPEMEGGDWKSARDTQRESAMSSFFIFLFTPDFWRISEKYLGLVRVG